MKLSEVRETSVSPESSTKLMSIVESMRDAALEVADVEVSEWETLAISWFDGRTDAILSNLGNGAIALVLNSETFSSNGVHCVSRFDVSTHHDEPSYAQEVARADWTHPSPGNSSGHRDGDEVVDQLESEVSRFIAPITPANVSIVVS